MLASFCVMVASGLVLSVLPPPRTPRHIGPTNQKQVALALISYSQDYDDHFPPAVTRLPAGEQGRLTLLKGWASDHAPASDMRSMSGAGLLDPYLKVRAEVLRGDLVAQRTWTGGNKWTFPAGRRRVGFLYNDLMAGQAQAHVADTSRVVLTCDGENLFWSAGHAWEPDDGPFDAEPLPGGGIAPGRGATVRDAPTRDHGGAYYAFVDGHVKWFKGDVPRPPIFFPPRTDDARSAKPGEPAPGARMLGYAGTFRLR
jgi:prepilin-type processing-associated H-X9-DG protein